MKPLKRWSRAHAWIFPAVALLFAVAMAAPASADNTAKCGGDGERPCPISAKATFIDEAETSCPKGSFFDVASFACWSCPSGFNRTGAPAGSGGACIKPVKTEYKDADKDGKVKFSDKTINRIKKGRFDKICKGDSFYDPAGGKFGACWDCPKGFIQNLTSSVKGGKACVKVSGASTKKADKVAAFSPCKKGFLDPRNGGECWSCPSGYFRGPTPVNAAGACIVKPEDVCDKGNILVYSKCLKKGACGKQGQRPCLIVERVPSCNAGLAEDFIANKCVNTAVALCLGVVRMANGAKGAVEAMTKLVKNTPGLKQAFDDQKKEQSSGSSETKNKKKGIMDKLFAEAKEASNEIIAVKEVADKALKNVGKIRKSLLREKFCTMTPEEGKKLLAELDLKPVKLFKKASILDDIRNPFIGVAHAAKPKTFYMSYAAGIAGGVGLGGTFELSLATDYDKHIGSFVSIGPAAVSNATIGASVNVGFYWRTNINDFRGWGFGMGVAGGPPAPPIGVGLDFYIPKGWHTLDGIGFNVGGGVGYFPADGNFSATYAWRMW